MSDREYMRKLLNEVLGLDRNCTKEQISKDLVIDWKSKWREEGCCKNFLVGFCPYLQFQNTKSDIGSCRSRGHDELVRDNFLSLASKEEKEAYEEDFYKLLSKLINDFERRLRRSKERVRDNTTYSPSNTSYNNNSSSTATTTVTATKATKIDGSGLVNAPTNNAAFDELEEKRTLLDYQLRESLKRIESLGEEGRISEAQSVMLESDQYKIQLDQIRHQQIAIVKEGMAASHSQSEEIDDRNIEKKMEICGTCGAFLIVGDSQKRIESHFEGKQHNGWARIRQTFEELDKKYSSSVARHNSYGSYKSSMVSRRSFSRTRTTAVPPMAQSPSTTKRSPPSEDGEVVEDGEIGMIAENDDVDFGDEDLHRRHQSRQNIVDHRNYYERDSSRKYSKY